MTISRETMQKFWNNKQLKNKGTNNVNKYEI